MFFATILDALVTMFATKIVTNNIYNSKPQVKKENFSSNYNCFFGSNFQN
jgi:hypothetical protein